MFFLTLSQKQGNSLLPRAPFLYLPLNFVLFSKSFPSSSFPPISIHIMYIYIYMYVLTRFFMMAICIILTYCMSTAHTPCLPNSTSLSVKLLLLIFKLFIQFCFYIHTVKLVAYMSQLVRSQSSKKPTVLSPLLKCQI
jgi:hypothetical protein